MNKLIARGALALTFAAPVMAYAENKDSKPAPVVTQPPKLNRNAFEKEQRRLMEIDHDLFLLRQIREGKDSARIKVMGVDMLLAKHPQAKAGVEAALLKCVKLAFNDMLDIVETSITAEKTKPAATPPAPAPKK